MNFFKYILFISVLNAPYLGLASSIKADFETDPITQGKTDSDDAAFYFHEKNPDESEILAVSKCDDSAKCGGLYIYDLKGRTKQILNVGKLNNVDSAVVDAKAYAYASNREDNGVSIFERSIQGKWIHLGSHQALDSNNQSFEPYGICAMKNKIALSSKLGMVYIYEYKDHKLKLIDTINLKNASKPYDSFIKDVTLKSVTKKNKLYKLDKYMKQRFVSEGCVFNKASGDLYISEERLGIWKYSTGKLELMKKIEGSHAEEKNRVFTDDLEGIDLYYKADKTYLSVSSQGINKILFFDLDDFSTVSSDSYYFNKNDPVTETDGVLVVSERTALFPEGFMVLHDDQNTDNDLNVLNANYKIIDMRRLKL